MNTTRRTTDRERVVPAWFRPEHMSNPILCACAGAGMSAAQALDELAKDYDRIFKMALRLTELQTTPILVGTVDTGTKAKP